MSLYLKQFSTHEEYETYINGDGAILPNVSICTTEGDVHYNPYVDPYAGHEYVEIGGLKWATMNVGATKVTDYGLFFQWGDISGYTADQVGSGEGHKPFKWTDYKYCNGTSSPGATDMTKYNASDGKTVLEASDDAVTAAWGGQWRMPTKENFNALLSATTSAWTTNYQGSGVAGMQFTDKTDSSKVLFFPAAGYCYNGTVFNVGESGDYWSSSLSTSSVVYGRFLFFFHSEYCYMNGNNRHYGCAVRGVVG